MQDGEVTTMSKKSEEELRLFRPDNDWYYNACLNYGLDDWAVYAHGYKHAAEVLIEHAANHRGSLDALVYPIVFVYRQSIELRLKKLVRDASRLLYRDSELSTKHDLLPRWDKLTLLLKEVEKQVQSTFDQRELAHTRKLIHAFDKVDSRSMAFRYPVDTTLEPSLPDMTHINIRVLHEYMEEVFGVLEGIDTMLSIWNDQQSEIGSDR